MAKHQWVELPNRERIRLHMQWDNGTIIVAYESPTHPGQFYNLLGIIPEGTVWKMKYYDILKQIGETKDHVKSPHEIYYFGYRLRFEAIMKEYALFGFIQLPKWLVQSIAVTLWVNDSRYWEFVF